MQGSEIKAKTIKAFKGVRDGEVYPVNIPEGAYVWGDLAQTAVDAGWAKWVRQKVETKAEKKTGGPTGAAQPSSSEPAGPAKTKRTYKRRKAEPKSS